MKLAVRFRAKAEQDAAGHAEFIQRGNMDAAIRFLDAMADACALLSRMIGRQRDGEPKRESRQGVRYFSVDRITRDQATDYARRKGVTLAKWKSGSPRTWATNLGGESP